MHALLRTRARARLVPSVFVRCRVVPVSTSLLCTRHPHPVLRCALHPPVPDRSAATPASCRYLAAASYCCLHTAPLHPRWHRAKSLIDVVASVDDQPASAPIRSAVVQQLHRKVAAELTEFAKPADFLDKPSMAVSKMMLRAVLAVAGAFAAIARVLDGSHDAALVSSVDSVILPASCLLAHT